MFGFLVTKLGMDNSTIELVVLESVRVYFLTMPCGKVFDLVKLGW